MDRSISKGTWTLHEPETDSDSLQAVGLVGQMHHGEERVRERPLRTDPHLRVRVQETLQQTDERSRVSQLGGSLHPRVELDLKEKFSSAVDSACGRDAVDSLSAGRPEV